MRFPEDIRWSTEQHFLIFDLVLILDLIDSFPLWVVLLFSHQASPDDLLGFSYWEIHIFEEHGVRTEVAEDVGVS